MTPAAQSVAAEAEAFDQPGLEALAGVADLAPALQRRA